VSRKVELFRIGGLMEIVGFPTDGTAGVAYSFTFTGTGGDGSYTFTHGTLPSGWALSSGGVLSNATPSAGTYSLLVEMADGSRSVPVEQTYTWVIA
jgi:hypothetical protein